MNKKLYNTINLIIRLTWARLGEERPEDIEPWFKNRNEEYGDYLNLVDNTKFGRWWAGWVAKTIIGWNRAKCFGCGQSRPENISKPFCHSKCRDLWLVKQFPNHHAQQKISPMPKGFFIDTWKNT
jgi:hypothetical protein